MCGEHGRINNSTGLEKNEQHVKTKYSTVTLILGVLGSRFSATIKHVQIRSQEGQPLP